LIILVPLTGVVLVMSLLSRNGTSMADKG
jgi:hypothetical protein